MLERLRRLAHEAAKFGVVGGVGFIVDVSLFNVLRFAGDPGLLEQKPLTAKGISVAVATVVTYLGNRHWTWQDRARSGARREVSLFFALNAIAMLIAVGCLAFSHYVLDLRSPLADNISANVVGLALGTLFRFWSYRTLVFKPHPAGQPGAVDEDESALDLVGRLATRPPHADASRQDDDEPERSRRRGSR